MSECNFCKTLAQALDEAEYNANPRPGRSETTRTEFSAALISDSYYGTDYCGCSRIGNFQLNFCPECGAPIKKNIVP